MDGRSGISGWICDTYDFVCRIDGSGVFMSCSNAGRHNYKIEKKPKRKASVDYTGYFPFYFLYLFL